MTRKEIEELTDEELLELYKIIENYEKYLEKEGEQNAWRIK